MSKIKVLVLPSDRTGVSKFRSVEPHMKLQELYNDDFHVDIVTAGTMDFDWDDTSYIKKYDIIHFHRTLPKVVNGQLRHVYLEEMDELLDKIHSLGIITIMDLDDYWEPSKEHPAYQIIINDKLPHKMKNNLHQNQKKLIKKLDLVG